MKKYGMFVNSKLVKAYSKREKVTEAFTKSCLYLGDKNNEVLIEVVEIGNGIILSNRDD